MLVQNDDAEYMTAQKILVQQYSKFIAYLLFIYLKSIIKLFNFNNQDKMHYSWATIEVIIIIIFNLSRIIQNDEINEFLCQLAGMC